MTANKFQLKIQTQLSYLFEALNSIESHYMLILLFIPPA